MNLDPQIATSQNRVYLNAQSLMLNIQDPTFDDNSNRMKSKK
jgi:hypothetical protein